MTFHSTTQIVARQRWVWGAMALAFLSLDLCFYHKSNGWLKRWMAFYGHDVLLCTFFFFFNRALAQARLNRVTYIGVFVFCGASGFEFAQLFRIYPGTFDPFDLLAYLSGVLLAVAADAAVGCLNRYLTRDSTARVTLESL